jgi:hypothetical protein
MLLKQTYQIFRRNGLRQLLLLIFVLAGLQAMAQAKIQIGGSVYGGGNEGVVGGNTTVTLRAGDLNKVFGGARMANVGGRAFVNIDGAHASNYMLINYVYGGNDISGTIGNSTVPEELIDSLVEQNHIDDSWNAFISMSPTTSTRTVDGVTKKLEIYIGQLFGGGNGAYNYESGAYENLQPPKLGKTYLEIRGGSIVYAFGGGNNATVTGKTVICVDNKSEVVNSIKVENENHQWVELLTDERIKAMGYNPGYTYPTSAAYQIGSFFGGNNMAAMNIRPVWNLKKGKIRNVYSGGNEGDMNSPDGLLLNIDPDKGGVFEVDNVYGGCRKANVIPLDEGGREITVKNLTELDNYGEPYFFPDGLAARTVIRGGHINNVYGGNDISGRISGGNAIGIRTAIYGDIYGGGNGSYPYTDNPALANDPIYGDFYYNPDAELAKAGVTVSDDKLKSVTALNLFRPNTEQVSIRVVGTKKKNTIIHGGIFCGGNSATLKNNDPENAMLELKFGSYVIADSVFLGNNGANMVLTNEENAEALIHEGVLRTYSRQLGTFDGYADHEKKNTMFNSMDLTDSEVFEKYMQGVSMTVKPRVVFDTHKADGTGEPENYVDYSSYVGSFFCGGNVGSMEKAGKMTLDFSHKLIIYNKVVAGCNSADVSATQWNAAYAGGLLGNPDGSGDKLELNLSGLKIRPMRWNTDVFDGHEKLEWNTIKWDKTNLKWVKVDPVAPAVLSPAVISSTDDLDRRLTGGNIYGGCYNSGHVSGNVVINLNATIVERDSIFDKVEEDARGEVVYYENDTYKIVERRSGVIIGQQGMDVLGSALNVFGGGKGRDTEIWGSTTINLKAGYTFQIFGGSEQGVIGKPDDEGDYTFNGKKYNYNPAYSCTVNLKGVNKGVSMRQDKTEGMADCEFIYGGGFEGPIAGNTTINLGNGRIFNSFAGSCNADILGYTETYVGRSGVAANGSDVVGFPFVRDYVYGGNDLGGKILGKKDFSDRVSEDDRGKVYSDAVLTGSAYVEYTQGRLDGIFGGCYGSYDYRDRYFNRYTDENGNATGDFHKPWMDNAIVNFRPNYTSALANDTTNVVNKIFGAGQGIGMDKSVGFRDQDMDKLQERSYVLINVPAAMENYKEMEVFGAGSWSGVGMNATPTEENTLRQSDKTGGTHTLDTYLNAHSTVIDLISGQIGSAYGGSFEEGITRRTVVNVPTASTIVMKNIFGGAYGVSNDVPCDVYEANVEYHGANARVSYVYGGNNAFRRTLYGRVNIDVPVKYVSEQYGLTWGSIYGAGYGEDSWSQYTEINLEAGAEVWEAFGGGYGGRVLNKETVMKWQQELDKNNGQEDPTHLPLGLGNYTDNGLTDALVHENGLGTKTNTNVYINKDALANNYSYGGGYGPTATVSGTTYIGLHGGRVKKDVYGGGWGGSVYNLYNLNSFTATANAYIEGGTLRKVFGGGYQGSVGYHDPETDETTTDVLGVANVVIGIRKDQTTLPEGYGFYKGVPAIQWNAYGAGEGGAVYGTSKLTLNNGYIGYYYDEESADVASTPFDERYIPKLDDETWKVESERAGRLKDYGNVFGAGYDDKSLSDYTDVSIWGGWIRGSLYGGGEIATVGRGKTNNLTGLDRDIQSIDRAGGTHVEMYNGHVLRHVFGGGKGYNDLGYGGTNELYTDGYVFGQTEVYIHGGEVGTVDGLADGYGNVFGGGDVGYVYGKGYFNDESRTEETGSPNHYYYYAQYKCTGDYIGADGFKYRKDDVVNARTYTDMSSDDKEHWQSGKWLTEDCKVVISPMLQVRPGKSVEYDNHTYGPYEYVPTEYLNTLRSKDLDAAEWKKLFCGDGSETVDPEDKDERGVIIRNAVFAGGNVSSNSEQTYANATTVFGNTTATLFDIYHRDFISVGTEHTGGLYGGGNLSMVDGYRELNITNYGTDYYNLNTQISLEAYRDSLTNRERAYFQLEYLCKSTYTSSNGETYTQNVSRLTEEQYNALPTEAEKQKWEQYGFCSIYAGRLLNTIQRADLCGVFGSRMVLQGAKDRVADVGDNTQYTINRVSELSLNKQRSVINGDADGTHGNYFGIYSVVNYLGNLTSDERFHDNRSVYNSNTHLSEETNVTYWDWKKDRLKYRDRNNGTSLNQVALASGVFLELTTEKSTKTKKDYGYITGIIELDLINVKKDAEGGGYVYARNEHRVPKYYPNKQNVILSEYNRPDGDWACSYKQYRYDNSGTASDWPEDGDVMTVGGGEPYQLVEYETSGNFIHKRKRIVDDCYPNNGVYNDGYVKSPAHYWYIKGEVYIYDQEVSAFAGSASAYSKEVKLPLTITAGSNGKLQLLNVQPSRYAYYKDANHNKIDAHGVKVDNESVTYYLNDVITWWDWHQLPDNEQAYFVEETYVNVDTCYVNGTLYPEGTYAILPTDTTTFLSSYTVRNKNNEAIPYVSTLFHTSNNISHDTGYVVTFDMDSPAEWNDWYSPKTGASTIGSTRKTKAEYQALSSSDQANYREGPTYTLKNEEGIKSGLYGQRHYKVSEIIPSEIVEEYQTTTAAAVAGGWTIPEGQAQVKPAYVALSATPTIQAGTGISETDYNALSPSDRENFKPAKVCLNTIRLSDSEYILQGELVPSTLLEEYAQRYMDYNNSQANMDPIANLVDALEYINSCVSDAYYCTTEGLFGGQYFNKGENYNALKAWCALTDDRTKFDFNYDAFDVLSDPAYPGEGHTNVYRSPYCDEKPVEYTAVYLGAGTYSYWLEGEDESTVAAHTITSASAPLTREQFEQIKNERRHYTMINVPQGSDNYTTYIAQKNFTNKGTPYAKGKELSASEYASLTPENQTEDVVKPVTIPKDANHEQTLYYCYEAYGNVSAGTSINSDKYRALKNYQDQFTIQGMEPTGTITLYVSRESNAKDVTAEKVITVVYQYSYYEDEDEGDGVSLVNELHVVNIHLKLESGVPEIGQLNAPSIVLPGSKLAMKAPSVNPGLYEIISNGWEMYDTEEDALMHRNGKPFMNNSTPVYWYQNQNMWVAFYSRTYLGYTYSNPVVVSVANYHDLHDVMADVENHMHIDHACLREPKIYIDQTKHPEENQLDLLKSLFDLSAESTVEGHTPVDVRIRDCRNLEFILQSDLSPAGSWTSLGDVSHCFEATLHGDGHTISGLDKSLFGKLCGEVYNLGVTGSFMTSGIADAGTGYLENCWVKKDEGTVTSGTPALFKNPTNTEERTVHLVNCYYPKENVFTAQNGATEKPLQAFYNGEVAYDLNGFYLFKRYCDHQDLSTYGYKYQQEDQNGVLQLKDGYYESQAGPYLLNDKEGHYVGCYVENRYADGDFIYSNGTLPESTDIRYRTVTTGTGENEITTTYIAPIWPDDYLFFGQALNYGQIQGYTHDSQPSSIKKGSDTRLLTTVDGNRVYRAPAYFGNSEKKVAHFNPYAVFARTDKTNANIVGFKGMTAIDFTGYGDGAYAYSLSDGQFYPPLLDDDGLTRFVNVDLTKNLLVYSGTSTSAAAKTDGVVSSYLHDYEYVEKNSYYHNVEEVELLSNTFNGHWVQKVDDDYVAQRDHLLVDKPGVINDFNAPIAYHFADGKRMWYERMPDNYVTLDIETGKTKGWEGFSLPFNVEIVTTPDKGELTHFYDYEDNSKGHEYWLRDFTGANGIVEDNLQANFTYPRAGTADKAYTNTFLWDYYYSWNEYDDKNRDHYQDTYYKGNEDHLVNTYHNYPRSQAGKPYLAGFPGETYYEFDLSGSFDAKNRNALNNLPDHPAPAKLSKQTIIFASAPGASIGVSDRELAAVKITNEGYNYLYCPTYASKELPKDSFMLSSDGSKYQRLTEAATVKAFRPYFVKTVASSQTRGESTSVNSIIFSNETSSMSTSALQPTNRNENLLVKAARKKIIVESQLHEEAEVRIVTPAGITLSAYMIEPGETVVTRVENGGVYIVYAADGRYVKKLIVK